MNKWLGFVVLAVGGLGMAACSVETAGGDSGSDEARDTVGPTVVTSEDRGGHVQSDVSSSKTDDGLGVRFDKRTNKATITPTHGQPVTVQLEDGPSSARAATRFVVEALGRGIDAAQTKTRAVEKKGDVSPLVYEPPAADCKAPCDAACDAESSECGAHICKFACGVACTK